MSWKSSTVSTLTMMAVLLGGIGCANVFSQSQRNSVAANFSTVSNPIRTLYGHSAWVYAIAFSPDGRYLASGSYNKQIKIWSPTDGTLLNTLEGHGDAVVALAISSDSKVLASGSWDNRIKLWQLGTGQILKTLKGHTDDVEAIALSHSGDY